MAWDFSTEPEFQTKLYWINTFVRDEVEPLDYLEPDLDVVYRPLGDRLRKIVEPLKQQVRDHGLWACHLGPELGGQGYGQVKLALINEILGRTQWGPIVFGCNAPDTGNAEILAMFGTDEQKARYLQPLLNGELFSAFSMTEPHAGADPRLFRTQAVRDSDGWLLNGEKYFTSNAQNATFLVVLAVTNPDVDAHRGMSMFLVPTETPGIEIVRQAGTIGDPIGSGLHPHVRYTNVHLPLDAMLGDEGTGFLQAQARLAGGRLHHAMRTVGMARKAFDMMCERVLSRDTFGGKRLADRQLAQAAIADSYIQIEQLRLLVLHTAWQMDQGGPLSARVDISASKIAMERVALDVVLRAMHLHGALGMSNETPLARMWQLAPTLGVLDGPTEVHQVLIAREVLKNYRRAAGSWPTEFIPDRRAAALEHFGLAAD